MKLLIISMLGIILWGHYSCKPHAPKMNQAQPASNDTTFGYHIGDCFLYDTVNPKNGFIFIEEKYSSCSFAVVYLDTSQQGMERFRKGKIRLVPRMIDNSLFGTECLSFMGIENKKEFDSSLKKTGTLRLIKNIPEVLGSSYLPDYSPNNMKNFIKQHTWSFAPEMVKWLPVESMLEKPGIADTLNGKTGK